MMGKNNQISEIANIDDLPLSSHAVRLLKKFNIFKIKDLKKFSADECRKESPKLADEISEIIEPYLIEFVNVEAENSNAVDKVVPPEMPTPPPEFYSPFLKRMVLQKQLELASSMPVQQLALSKYVFLTEAFEKWGIKTIADLLREKQERFLKLYSVGKRKMSILLATVNDAIGGEPEIKTQSHIPEQPDFFLLGRRLDEAEERLLKEIPVESVVDDVRACNVFRALKIKNAAEAAALFKEKFLKMKNAGVRSLEKAAEDIETALKELSCPSHEIQLNEEDIKHIVEEHILNVLAEVEEMVLKDRYGLWDGIKETLDDIGNKLHLTRERVRQIQEKARNDLRRKAIPRLFAMRLLEKFKVFAQEEIREKHEGLTTLTQLESIVAEIDNDALTVDLAYAMIKDIYLPSNKNFLAEGLLQYKGEIYAVDNKTLNNFEKVSGVLEPILVAKGKPLSIDELTVMVAKSIHSKNSTNFIKQCVDLCDQTGLDSFGRIGLKRWPHFNSRNMESMMYTALRDIGAPSHYSYIAAKMNTLFPDRAPFKERCVHAAIGRFPKVFVWVGRRGTYGLADWGMKKAPFIRDFLAQELRNAGHPLQEDELVSRGLSKYGYKESSIRMTLALQNRWFKKLPDGSYKLNH